MPGDQATPRNIDEYIAALPADVQEVVRKIRMTIREAAPQATETIKYRMPTFIFRGNLVYFAAFKTHIGFYPPVTGSQELRSELAQYEGPKGSLKFPLDRPIPYELISTIVKFRVEENLGRVRVGARNEE